MNKVLSIIVFFLTVLFICCWATIDRFKKNNSIEEITYTIKQTYNLFSDENLVLEVYSSKANALIKYATEADAYILDTQKDTLCKVKVIESILTDNIVYKQEIYYVFSLIINLNVEEIIIEDSLLELYFENQTVRLTVGNIYCSKRLGNALFGVRGLHGLTFENPFLSLGAICLTIKNTTNMPQTITNVFLLSNHKVYLLDKGHLCNESNSLENFDYHYQEEKKFASITIAPNEEISLLFGITYEKDLGLNKTPIILTINQKKYYLDNFTFVKSNDIMKYDKLIYRGYINGFQS